MADVIANLEKLTFTFGLSIGVALVQPRRYRNEILPSSVIAVGTCLVLLIGFERVRLLTGLTTGLGAMGCAVLLSNDPRRWESAFALWSMSGIGVIISAQHYLVAVLFAAFCALVLRIISGRFHDR
jgi:uncharacterized membrane protein YhiD involved in acid resistance